MLALQPATDSFDQIWPQMPGFWVRKNAWQSLAETLLSSLQWPHSISVIRARGW